MLVDQQRLVVTLKESLAAASFGKVLSSWETKLVTSDAVCFLSCNGAGFTWTEKARFATIDNDIQGVLREAARV